MALEKKGLVSQAPSGTFTAAGILYFRRSRENKLTEQRLVQNSAVDWGETGVNLERGGWVVAKPLPVGLCPLRVFSSLYLINEASSWFQL